MNSPESNNDKSARQTEAMQYILEIIEDTPILRDEYLNIMSRPENTGSGDIKEYYAARKKAVQEITQKDWQLDKIAREADLFPPPPEDNTPGQ